MKTGSYLLIGMPALAVAIVVIVTLGIQHDSTMITPSKPYLNNSDTIFVPDEKKARELAERYVDELNTGTYGCRFDSLSGIFDAKSNLQYVRIGYDCNRYVGAFVILEDPDMTRVINVTTYPLTRFGPWIIMHV
jgi:hypothetical protein